MPFHIINYIIIICTVIYMYLLGYYHVPILHSYNDKLNIAGSVCTIQYIHRCFLFGQDAINSTNMPGCDHFRFVLSI